MAHYIKLVDCINRVVRIVLIGMFIVMFLTAFAQVIVRNMTTGSIPWSDELCRFLIIYIVWLGAGLAARSNRLIRMEVLPSLTRMSDKTLHMMYWICGADSLLRGSGDFRQLQDGFGRTAAVYGDSLCGNSHWLYLPDYEHAGQRF